MISVIIPTYNEESTLSATINSVRQSASAADNFQIIVTDGGSTDKTIEIAKNERCQIVNSKKGRGNQLNAGAQAADGNILLFLHADTYLPDSFDVLVKNAINSNAGFYNWGRFNIKLSGNHIFFRLIETMISLRSRVTGIATGDQAIFLERKLFEKISGYKDIPLMEDIELTKRLRRISAPICLSNTVITSSRRWENDGIVRTILLMWLLRGLYFIGVNPTTLQKYYS